jgi:hypothetical protein
MMLRKRTRARAAGRQGCDCCNGDMSRRDGRTALRRRVRRIETRKWKREEGEQ